MLGACRTIDACLPEAHQVYKPFAHRDETPERWLGHDMDFSGGVLERLVEERAASLDAVDVTSPAALAGKCDRVFPPRHASCGRHS